MITVRRATINDTDIIKAIYADEKIFPYVTDDGTPDIDAVDFTGALGNQGMYFLLAEDNDKPVGVFLFHPWNTVCFEMHSAVLPAFRGQGSMDAARAAGLWMFSNTLCQKIVTHIAVTNYAARALAKVCGMKQEGINRKSFLKNAGLLDQYIFGICKEDV